MATAEQLKALRKKYGLGEFKKTGAAKSGVPGVRQRQFTPTTRRRVINRRGRVPTSPLTGRPISANDVFGRETRFAGERGPETNLRWGTAQEFFDGDRRLPGDPLA